MRFVAPLLPLPQQWTLVDHDADLLGAVRIPDIDGVRVQTLTLDLADPRVLDAEVDLVSMQALLDLVSEEWLDHLVEWLVQRRLPLLAALSVDGRVDWSPPDPRDVQVQSAFRAHQLTDRGFGASPGPQAAPLLGERLAAAGYRVEVAQTDWQIPSKSTQMLQEMVNGTAQAAEEACHGITSEAAVASWRADRLAAVTAEKLSLRVGHLDLLAVP